MSRFRLFLLGLLVVLAVSVASTSSASAETCAGGTHLVFCTSPGNLPLAGESILGLGGLALLASILGGAEAKFHCPKFDVSGVLGKLGAFTILFLFLGCIELSPANCKLTAADEKEIDAKLNGQQQSLTLALATGSGVGEELTSLHVEGKECAATGTFPVTGRQMVEKPTGGEGRVEQEIVAKKSESFLKLGTAAASFSGVAKVMLGGVNIGSAWLVMHGE